MQGQLILTVFSEYVATVVKAVFNDGFHENTQLQSSAAAEDDLVGDCLNWLAAILLSRAVGSRIK